MLAKVGILDPVLEYSESNIYNSREALMVNKELYGILTSYNMGEYRKNYLRFKKHISEIINISNVVFDNIKKLQLMLLLNIDYGQLERDFIIRHLDYIISYLDPFLIDSTKLLNNIATSPVSQQDKIAIIKIYNYKKHKSQFIKRLSKLFGFCNNHIRTSNSSYEAKIHRVYNNSRGQDRIILKAKLDNISLIVDRTIMIHNVIGTKLDIPETVISYLED